MKVLPLKLLSKIFFYFIAINLAINMSIWAQEPANTNSDSTNKEQSSLLSKAKKAGISLAETIKDEGSKFAMGIAAYFAKRSYESAVIRPIYDKSSKNFNDLLEIYIGKKIMDPKEAATLGVSVGATIIPTEYKVAGAALLATLYIAYKWYTKEDKAPNKTITIDIRPKNFDGFILLVALGKNRMEIFRDHAYQLENIKRDLEIKNKAGLNLIPELYPEFVNALTAEQKQYLNDLIKQTLGLEQDILIQP